MNPALWVVAAIVLATTSITAIITTSNYEAGPNDYAFTGWQFCKTGDIPACSNPCPAAPELSLHTRYDDNLSQTACFAKHIQCTVIKSQCEVGNNYPVVPCLCRRPD
jgi:hypothetical protein